MDGIMETVPVEVVAERARNAFVDEEPHILRRVGTGRPTGGWVRP